ARFRNRDGPARRAAALSGWNAGEIYRGGRQHPDEHGGGGSRREQRAGAVGGAGAIPAGLMVPGLLTGPREADPGAYREPPIAGNPKASKLLLLLLAGPGRGGDVRTRPVMRQGPAEGTAGVSQRNCPEQENKLCN